MLAIIIFAGFTIIMSIITFIVYGHDKRCAIKKELRIKESTLFLLSLLGGSLGAVLGMLIFRHKTLHFKFWVVNILLLIVYLGFLGLLIYFELSNVI